MCIATNVTVTVQTPNRTATAGDDGAVNLALAANWTTGFTRRGHLRPVSAREVFADQQTEAVRTHTLELWSDPQTRQLSADARIQYRDQDNTLHTLNIVGITAPVGSRTVMVSLLEAAS